VTIVLVHGNPETAEVWSPLVEALDRPDVVRLSPPGFGSPVPSGWDATPGAYRCWLAAELAGLEQPVDLVGHDWGGVHVLGVAMTQPQLLRSWCVDSIGLLDPDYEWHSLAVTWQTPGIGEEAIAPLASETVVDRLAFLTSMGIPRSVAEHLAPGCGQVDRSTVLSLYRHARQPHLSDLGAALESASKRPGMVLLATDDRATGTESTRRRAARVANASVHVLPDVGHWWMLEDPDRAATALKSFWEGLNQPSPR
jgi:pimeloyl-ACP methyl ester carboxylesterase